MSTSGLSQILPSGGPLADSMSKNRKEKKGGEETGEHDTGIDYKHKKLLRKAPTKRTLLAQHSKGGEVERIREA